LGKEGHVALDLAVVALFGMAKLVVDDVYGAVGVQVQRSRGRRREAVAVIVTLYIRTIGYNCAPFFGFIPEELSGLLNLL